MHIKLFQSALTGRTICGKILRMESTNNLSEPLFPEAEAKLKVPHGTWCYKNVHVEGLGLDEYDSPTLQSQFPDDPGARWEFMIRNTRVYCPYWSVTDYGTVKCAYLGVEAIGISEESMAKAARHFGSQEAAIEASTGFLLGDAVKECNVNKSA